MGRDGHLLVEGAGGPEPQQHDAQQNSAQVGGGGRQGAKADDHDLLDCGASALAQGVAHHVDGGLALQLRTYGRAETPQRATEA